MGSFRFGGDLFSELNRLQQSLDQLFQTDGMSIRGSARGTFPAVNVGSSADSVEVIAFAPGVDASKLQVTVDKGLLVIAGERTSEAPKADEKSNVHAQERFQGSFRRVISLPEDADPAKVDASFRDGVLHVTVAKRESSKPRQITVS
ncbi:Hsp20/alpha crystallin family protein [Piscinibacter koreensis]|uniref:Hsp20/alpha crystallin family protein n=1 Tax=Piscinibacter koreensis TaxID=2742824 RepID=UPI003CC90C51